MTSIRVALDAGPLHGHRTGIGAAVAELTAALERRADVIVTPYLLSFRTTPVPPVRRLPLPAAAAHRLWAHLDHPRLDRALGDVDVVHGTNYVVPPSRRPRVVSVYDVWFLAHPEQAAPAVARAGAVLRRSVHRGATVHASSHATAERVAELIGPERIEVIHLGPLPPPAPGPIRAGFAERVGGHPFVLALGTLERRKNLPALVDAYARAVPEVPGLHLVLAGADGDDAGAVAGAVEGLPASVGAGVIRAGSISDAEKAWLLERASALAYPSLDEGFGFPLLEAQRASLPIVATRAGSIPEVAGEGALLVDVGDADALAAALVRAVADDDLRARLVARGRRNLDRFEWGATADAMVALYRRLREGS
jgi:glycosyltransferase involved in cell wall biosynthesis